MLPAKRVIICFCIQLLFLSAVTAQSEIILRDIQESLEQYSSQHFGEKIFVHADREFYVAGESMWFKLYVVDGNTHKAVDISKVAYLEVLDDSSKTVLQSKIRLDDGVGSGSFYLPLSLQSGTYTIRAYTSWMKNFSSDFYFQKPVTIVNTFLNPSEGDNQNSATTYDVQFFPEGGDLVAGITSKVAFRAVGKDGKGVNFKGAVTNQDNDTVALLEPLKFGIGHFYLQPLPDMAYKATIKAEEDTITNLTFSLPDVQEKGYVMQVNDNKAGRLEISVMSGTAEFLYLIAQTRNEIKVAEAQKIEDGKAVFSIDKKALGEGISQLTIFNHEQQPVAERLFFKYPEQTLELRTNTDKQTYFAREKVEVDLSAMVNEVPAVADLSLAVYKLDSLSSEGNGNIMSYFWLSSDLKGSIESPEYYFENSDARAAEAMDNLMLTHGWRRFRWEDVLQKKEPQLKFIPEYEGHIIKGRVTDKGTGAPVKGVNTYLSVPGKLIQFYASGSDENGEFLFVTENFYGPKEMILQTHSTDSLYNLTLHDPYAKESLSLPALPFELSSNIQNSLRSRHIQMQAQNIYWEEERNKFVAPALDSLSYWGPSDKTYLLDDYTRFPTMEEVMREYVYEVRVRKEKGKFKFMVFNPATETFYTGNPLVLLDGVPVFDIDKIIAFNPLKVESLEVFNSKINLGADILFPGIVNYTTYKGDLAGFQLDPNLLKIPYEGLQFQREFFHPVYEKEREKGSRMPDFRNLLFWSPDVKTDTSGSENLSFYTSDIPGEYIMVLQGMTKDGKTGYNSIRFKVESSL